MDLLLIILAYINVGVCYWLCNVGEVIELINDEPEADDSMWTWFTGMVFLWPVFLSIDVKAWYDNKKDY